LPVARNEARAVSSTSSSDGHPGALQTLAYNFACFVFPGLLPKRLSGEGVGIVVKRSVEALGFDPSQFAGHSLRAGLATSAAAAGKSERAIMGQTGHRSLTTVRRYIREGNLFRENAAEGLGL
jgi:integrase